jgi:hypothetical protein
MIVRASEVHSQNLVRIGTLGFLLLKSFDLHPE